MGYTLTAVFGRAETLRRVEHPLLVPAAVTLGAGFAMRTLRKLQPDIDPAEEGELTPEQEDERSFRPHDLADVVDRFGAALVHASELGPVAYVHIETFAGSADESVVVWRDGALEWSDVGEDLDDDRLSAEAFRRIGVQAAGGADEFDTLGLGRHRETADWLGEP